VCRNRIENKRITILRSKKPVKQAGKEKRQHAQMRERERKKKVNSSTIQGYNSLKVSKEN